MGNEFTMKKFVIEMKIYLFTCFIKKLL